MKYFFVFTISTLSILLFNITPLNTAMTGGSFEVIADTFSFVSSPQGSVGGTFTLTDSGGEFFATTTTGGDITLIAGFQSASRDQLSLTLDKNSIDFGELSLNSVTTDNIVATVSASDSGYMLSLSEDGDLREGANTIDDVLDGTVTAGVEEYGVRTAGSHGLLANDTAIDGSLSVASSFNETVNIDTTVQFSVAIGQDSLQGSYSHQVSFTLVENP